MNCTIAHQFNWIGRKQQISLIENWNNDNNQLYLAAISLYGVQVQIYPHKQYDIFLIILLFNGDIIKIILANSMWI